MAAEAHQTQSRGKLMATSFQRLQTRRKLNVPAPNQVACLMSSSTMWRNISESISAGRREMAICVFWMYFNR